MANSGVADKLKKVYLTEASVDPTSENIAYQINYYPRYRNAEIVGFATRRRIGG